MDREVLRQADSQLLHLRCMELKKPASHRLHTKLISTISHGSHDMKTIVGMIEKGLNVVRINLSHDSRSAHLQTIELVRMSLQEHARIHGYIVHVAIAFDTKGPEVRTGKLFGYTWHQVTVETNMIMELSIDKKLMNDGSRNCVYVDCPKLIERVEPGNKIYLNDGAIVLVATQIEDSCVVCKTLSGGLLTSNCTVNVPGIDLGLPDISSKDSFDLKFAVSSNIDMIFASNLRKASTIDDMRHILGENGKYIKIIAKIDSKAALEHVDELLATADGLLVPRKSLCIEMTVEDVFEAERTIFAKCNQAGKPVICASQMLKSMQKLQRPTPDDIADLGTAVLNGADCVMFLMDSLQDEETTDTFAQVCREAELALYYDNQLDRNRFTRVDAADAVAVAAVDTAQISLASLIIVLTVTGRSAYLVKKYRPRCPIIAVTRCARTARQTLLYRGITPLLYPALPLADWMAEVDARIHYSLLCAKKMGLVVKGDAVVVVSPKNDGDAFTTSMRLIYAFFEEYALECSLRKDAMLNATLPS